MPLISTRSWLAALRLFVRLAAEEARLCAALFPPQEQAVVVSQVTASGAQWAASGARTTAFPCLFD